MKVSELIEKLNELPSDLEVIMSCDAEGNRYSKACEIEAVFFEDDGTEIYILDNEEVEESESEEGVTLEPNAVAIWPI